MISEVVLHKQGNSGRTVVKDQIEAVLLPNHCRHQRLEESFLYQIKENGYLALSPRLSNRNKIKKRRKEKTTKKTKTTTKKPLYQLLLEEYLQICIFLGDLLQGKRLVGAFVSVETTNKIFEEINFCTIGKNPSKIRIPLSLFQFC